MSGGLKAFIADNFTALGIDISIVQWGGTNDRFILRLAPPGEPQWGQRWDRLDDPTVVTAPTLRLGHEEARALLDALQNHFQDSADLRTQRRDFEHVRARQDHLTDVIIEIARGRQE